MDYERERRRQKRYREAMRNRIIAAVLLAGIIVGAIFIIKGCKKDDAPADDAQNTNQSVDNVGDTTTPDNVIVDDELLLDLCYEEDSNAQVDLNCIMTEQGELVEIQGTGEGRAFTIQEQRQLVDLCAKGIDELLTKQREALALAEKQAEEGSR